LTTKGPRLNLSKPYFSEVRRKAIAGDIEDILASGRLMFGPWLKKFEESYTQLTERKFAIGLNTCTTALQIALTYADVRGKEVLVPAGSFITDVSVVKFAGGIPVLVDMNPDTLGPDLSDLKRKITANTRAMIWVHLVGIVASDHQALLEFARSHEIFLLEDAAHAHGAVADGKPAGSFGDASAFSFYPTKIITSGTGGMLTTDDGELAKFAREMRIFGKREGSTEIIHHGNDWFLDEIRACVGYHHTEDLEEQVARRREIAQLYAALFSNQPGFQLLNVPDGSAPAWYQYPIFLDASIDREALARRLLEVHNIEAKGIYRPIHQETIFANLNDGSLRSTEETLLRSLCIPMHGGLRNADIDRIATAVISEIYRQLD
jgi:perosamine synthetase